ncbi:Anaphase-promoting complex subunit [Trema orientale]|uniref:Anaphase-promoting complex subunit 11 n=1 Tax=Trema orientale TaxID=63057 RepID=A0A2P5DRB0_TREOI|nr:Anaphase-promoting complex subunit [Trema orientale]
MAGIWLCEVHSTWVGGFIGSIMWVVARPDSISRTANLNTKLAKTQNQPPLIEPAPICSSLLHQRWHAVASWTWDAQDETCGICRMAFDGCCPDCKLPGDDCPLIWGACNHAFHLHCILKWVNSQTSQAHCPMCRREWQFKG